MHKPFEAGKKSKFFWELQELHRQCSPLLLRFSPSSAVQQVLPALHEAAPPEPEGEPPPAARRPHAVRPLPQGHRHLAGAGTAVLEVRVHSGENGRGQGNQRVSVWAVCLAPLL